MKIKKIGKTTEDINFSHKKNYKTLFTLFIVILSLIIAYFIFFTDKNNTTEKSVSTDLSIKQKELELKEKELKLKEKEINQKNSAEESSLIKAQLKNWITAINNRNYDFINYYAPIVNYYSWEKVSKDKVTGDKRNFFNNWDSFYLTISEPETEKFSDDKYLCKYDKTINSSNKENGKVYEAKVRSKLIFQRLQNNWLITDEDDETVYYKNKNW